MERRFYSVEEIATFLGCSVSAIRKWIRMGKIPFCRFNGAIRFDILEINKWTSKNRRTVIYDSI